MVCFRWFNHVLCFTRDITVEEAILDFLSERSQKLHDGMAVINKKTIIDYVIAEFRQFSRVDVLNGLKQLIYEGRLFEVYPDEYRVNEEWE